jgi:hypothetical protein
MTKYYVTYIYIGASVAQSVQRLGYGIEGPDFVFPQNQEIFFNSETSRPTLRLTQHFLQRVAASALEDEEIGV